jgi:ketosteroid isomerase-like protein
MDVTDVTTARTRPLSAVVREYYRNIDRQDFKAALSCYMSDAVYRRPGYHPFVGFRAISTFLYEGRVISRGRHELEAVLEDGDMVAVHGSFHGASRSGDPIDVRFADFWRFSDLLVIERDTYFDVAAV